MFLRALQEALALFREDQHKTAGVDVSVGDNGTAGSGSDNGSSSSNQNTPEKGSHHRGAHSSPTPRSGGTGMASGVGSEEEVQIAYFTEEQLCRYVCVRV